LGFPSASQPHDAAATAILVATSSFVKWKDGRASGIPRVKSVSGLVLGAGFSGLQVTECDVVWSPLEHLDEVEDSINYIEMMIFA
jgi:hypothetical protein